MLYLIPGGSWLQPQKCVREIIDHRVVLRWKVIPFRLSLLPNKLRMFVRLVHVVWDGSHVIEELCEDRPTLIFTPDGPANNFDAAFSDGVSQGEAPVFKDTVA